MSKAETLCLYLKYVAPDGGEVTLKLPSIPASKRVASVKKAFVKAAAGKHAALAALHPDAVALTRDGAAIAADDGDAVGRVFADGDVVRAEIAKSPAKETPPAEKAAPPPAARRGAEDALLARAEQQVFRTNAKIRIGGTKKSAPQKFYSQWAEDAFLSKYFLNARRPDGSFVELGACDGVSSGGRRPER